MKTRSLIGVLILAGTFVHAQNSTLDSLANVIKTSPDDTNKVKTYQTMAKQVIYSDPATAHGYILDSKELAEELGYQKGLADALSYEGVYHNIHGQYDKALEQFQAAAKIYDELKLGPDQRRIRTNIAAMHQAMHDFDKAQNAYEEVLVLCREEGDSSGVSDIYANIALIYRTKGDFQVAMDYHLKALKIRENLGDEVGMASIYSNMGIIYGYQGKTEEAIQYFRTAWHIQLEAGDLMSAGNAVNNIGTQYLHTNRHDSALIYYEQAHELFAQVNSVRGYLISYQGKGNAYCGMKKYKEGIREFNKAYDILKGVHEPQVTSALLLNMGRAFQRLGVYDSSLYYLDKGYEMSVENQIVQHEIDALEYYTETYQGMGDFKTALSYNQQHHELKDSIFTLEKNQQLVDVQEKYESEKKALQNQRLAAEVEEREARLREEEAKGELKDALLKRNRWYNLLLLVGLLALAIVLAGIYYLFRVKRRSNEQLTYANEQLNEANRQLQIEKQNMELKALLAQINPHFIFNALNSIQKHITVDDKKSAYDHLSKFGKLMRGTLENSEEKTISIAEEIEHLQLYVDLESQRLEHGLEYAVNVDQELDIYNLKIPPMLIQPFIENAIRHGVLHKSEKGKIKLDLVLEDEDLTCRITDNGIGREASSKLGHKDPDHKSMGTSITLNRLKNLWTDQKEKARMVFQDLTNDQGRSLGTTVEIKIPLEF